MPLSGWIDNWKMILKLGDLVYEKHSGRTGIITGGSSNPTNRPDSQLKFGWFVEVHWISNNQNITKNYTLGLDYVLTNSLKIISNS